MPESESPAVSTGHLHLRFNGADLRLKAPLSLADVLANQGTDAGAVATAVNGQFVAKEQRATTGLKTGDDVMTFQAIVGG